MMECKKALSASEVANDIDKAKEWLRKHGSAKASSKVAGREALEGLVGIKINNESGVGSVVKVASETDFASRSEVFSTFVQEVADAAAAQATTYIDNGDRVRPDPNIANFMKTSQTTNGKPISESLNDAILAIRENLQVDSISVMKTSSPNSILAGYVHGRASPQHTCGSLGSLVELEIIDDKQAEDIAQETAKKLAMHIVAAKPHYLNPTSVPTSILSKEKDILLSKMNENSANANKPPEILEKIINGQLRKFYESVCLTEQAHMVEEGNPKVGKVLKGLGLEVKGFKLMGL